MPLWLAQRLIALFLLRYLLILMADLFLFSLYFLSEAPVCNSHAYFDNFPWNFYVCICRQTKEIFINIQLMVFDDLEVPTHKTKNIVNYVKQMDNTKKILLVDGGSLTENLKLATQNLHYVNILPSIVSPKTFVFFASSCNLRTQFLVIIPYNLEVKLIRLACHSWLLTLRIISLCIHL